MRSALFIAGSLGAHIVVLALVQGQLAGDQSSIDVLQVSAVMRPSPPAVEEEPTREPPELEEAPPEPEPEPPARPRVARRRQAPPEPACPQVEPAAEPSPLADEHESLPPPPAPVIEPAPAATQPASTPTSNASARTTSTIGAADTPRSASSGGMIRARGARGRRGGGGGDTCREVATDVARQLRAIAPYPRWARSMGLEGELRLSFRVGRDGTARGLRVITSTGNAGLDRYALGAARRINGLPQGCRRPIIVPVAYRPIRR